MMIRRKLLLVVSACIASAAVASANVPGVAQAADSGARRHRIERYGKSGVPETVAVCLVDAEDRARTEGKLGTVEWTAPERTASVVRTAKPAARHAPDTQVEVEGVGHNEKTGGWTPVKAQCAYRNGRLTALNLNILPQRDAAPPLNLALKPEVDASTESQGATTPPPPPAPPREASRSAGSTRTIRPTLQHLPTDTPVREPPPNFLRDHRFGVELKSPF